MTQKGCPHWFLAPFGLPVPMVDGAVPTLLVGASGGNQAALEFIPGSWVHVANPTGTIALVGVRQAAHGALAGWAPVAGPDWVATFTAVCGRAPVAAEIPDYVGGA